MQKQYILALDQGTTSSRAVVFDRGARIVGMAQQEFRQIFPQPGWVEHDPEEIWQSLHAVLERVLEDTDVHPAEIAAIGISNQRETAVVWERATGKPIHNAIVWQCRRSAAICEELRGIDGFEADVKERTGLVVDAYFSGTKIKWLLDNVDGARQRARNGELLFGTIDTWLLWKLTGGRVHATDRTNASRTMLYNIRDLKWDDDLLQQLDIPPSMLPEVRNSCEIYGETVFRGVGIPIAGVAGDQQAALFGQSCFEPGEAKNTYGTGCFMLMNTGERLVQSQRGLLSTIGIAAGGTVQYALEGSIFTAGAVVQWLRDEMRLISAAAESERCALEVDDCGGVYLVPAFTGLGAPWWDMYARGTITGITRGTGRNHIVRAALEAIAYQTRDVLDAMAADSGIALAALKVDGGAAANNFLMQFQADILGVEVQRPTVVETTALGAAFLAGLAVGFWSGRDELRRTGAIERRFMPQIDAAGRSALYDGWLAALARTRICD
jgi:glycerol kinase